MFLLLAFAVCASAEPLLFNHYNGLNYFGGFRSYAPYATYAADYTPVAYKTYAAQPVAYVAGNNFKYDVATAHPGQVAVVKHYAAAPAAVVKTVETPAVAVAAPSVYNYANAAVVTKTYAPSYAATSQYHEQDALGQYKFGYQGDTSSRDEVKTADGTVQGQYSYIDANNVPQHVSYVADQGGFRVAATNLPVDANTPVAAAAVAPVAVGQVAYAGPTIVEAKYNPAVIVDEVNPHVPYTPEVAAARANHLIALHAARVKRSTKSWKSGSYGKPYGKSYGKVLSRPVYGYKVKSYGKYGKW